MSTTETEREKPILCGTRTGKKVHLGYAGSSVTNCGHWQKVANSHYGLDLTPEQVRQIAKQGDLVLCEHCFPNSVIPGLEDLAKKSVEVKDMSFDEIHKSGLAEGTDLTAQTARHRAAYLLRTMPVAKRFAYLSVNFEPRLQKVFNQVMQEKS